MKKITRAEMRARAVDSVLGSLRIEKLHPSKVVVSGMKSCVLGQDTTTHLLQETINHHAQIRRG
jgi:hypothetical protein